MAKYTIETKNAWSGGYYPTGKDDRHETFNSLVAARATLMRRIRNAPYRSELGCVLGSRNGMGTTIGIVRYNRGSDVFTWDDYGTGKRSVLRKDGGLGRQV